MMINSKKQTLYGRIVGPVLRSVALASLALTAVGALSRAALAQTCAQQQKLTAGDAQADDEFGRSTALDGDTAVFGAANDDDGGFDAGAVYVFLRNAGVWTQQQKLTASDAETIDRFGISVAVSGDTAIVGAHLEDSGANNAGAAYIFTRSGGVWTQQQKINAGDPQAGYHFGVSVSVSGDTAVIGAYGNPGGSDFGAAYVFQRAAGVWTQQQKLTASDAQADDIFGGSVSLSGDTAVIGAQREDAGGSNAGAAYVFTHTAGVWTQQQKILAGDAQANDLFGVRVSVSGDTAVIGADGEDAGGSGAGAAYVFLRTNGVWTQQQKLMAGDPHAGNQFGTSVSVSGDVAVIGANGEDGGGPDAGAAYGFKRAAGVWTQMQKVTAFDAQAGDDFGAAVSVSGSTVVVGAEFEDAGGADAGAGYVFGTSSNCDDGNPCTDDACDSITGCNYTLDDVNLCSDGDACTNDLCTSGSCVGTPIDCDDHDPCTDDTCNGQGLCDHTPNGCGATGACCTLPGCQVTTEGFCVVLGGNYAGNASTCLAAACPTVATLQEPGCRSSKNPLLTAPSSGPCAGGGANCGGPIASEDPVYLFSGELYQSDVDLRIPGRGLDFVWARKYRSRVGPLTYQGNGWDFSYNISIASLAGAEPGEVRNARFQNKQTISWDPPIDTGGPIGNLRYCTLRSTDRSNFASGATTIFVESDGVDQSSTDGANPVSGGVFYYLISAKNGNGEGTLGTHSSGSPRSGLPCGTTQGDVVVMDGDTRRDVYELQPDGSRTAAQLFQVLTENPDGSHTLTFPDRGKWNFHAFNHSRNEGKIASIVDRNGNALGFQYDSLGRLATVIDTLGRNVQVAYGANSFIASITDFAGRQVVYTYYNDGDAGGAFGDLKSVTTPAVTGTPTGNDFPAGKTTTYTYSTGFANSELNHNLLTITDPKGQTYLTNVYSSEVNPAQINFDRVTRQVWGNPGDIIDYVYVAQTPSAANNYASLRTIVNDRVGNVKEYFFNAANRDVMLREFTGRADPDQPTTESVNRPTGQLRIDDPPFFETRWGYNSDSQPTAVMNPNSSQESLIYAPANVSRRSQANLLQRCTLAGPLGGDQAQICETFEYDASFGSCCGSNFATRHVDGRGNETLHSYDANGNRVHTQHSLPSSVEDYEYNAWGQLTAHVLPDNGGGHRQRDEYVYYGSGPQRGYLHQRIADATGFALATIQEYDVVGNLVRTIDARGNDTLYTVNQHNQTVRETSREVEAGSGIRYRKDWFYDANDNVVRIDVQNTAADGVVQANANFTTVTEFEILDRPVRTCREVGSYTGAIPGSAGLPACTGLPAAEFITEEHQYDANRNLVLVRHGEAAEGRQPENATATQYDERDLVFRVVRAPGDAKQSSTQSDYDASRNLKKLSQGLESNPRISLNNYDGYNRLASTIDPMGNSSTSRYDAGNNVVSQLSEGEPIDVSGDSGNVRLAETTHVYDAMNRIVREEREFFDPLTQLPLGAGRSVTETSYTANSQTDRVVDDNGHETLYEYDTANRVSTVTDAKGNTRTYDYDANSNQLSVTELELSDLGSPSETFVTTNTYDNLDRLTTATDNLGNQRRYLYDSRGNRTRQTDAKGNETRDEYDGASRLVRTEHDLTDTGDGTGAVLDTIATSQAWDDSSRLVGQTDDNGNTTTYAYEALDRLIATTYADATVHQQTYDVHDNVLTATDANGSVTASTYDAMDRVTAQAITRAPGVLGTTSEVWEYDGLSRVVHAENDDSIVTRQYDSLSNPTRETQGSALGSWNLSATFDGVGNRTSVTYSAPFASSSSVRTVTTTYDDLNRVTTISEGGAIATYDYMGPDRVERRDNGNNTRATYDYDGVRRPIRITHAKISPTTPIDDRSFAWNPVHSKTSRTDLLPGGVTHGYSYDSADRLIHSSVPGTPIDYALDGVGNRIAVGGGPDPGPYTMSATTPEEADLQVNQYTSTPFDARQYDRNGNLVSSGAMTLSYDYRNRMMQFGSSTYAYDAFGRRIVASGAHFFLDSWQEVEEYAGTQLQATYVYGPSIDEVLRMERDLDSNTVLERYYYHTDDLYNVTALTDATGARVERYDYDDFGKPRFFDGAGTPIPQSGFENRLLFTGRRLDPESGLYYYRTRYLDPRAGRFTARDSIGTWGDAANLGNAATYIGNAPWSGTDAMGLAKDVITGTGMYCSCQRPFSGTITQIFCSTAYTSCADCCSGQIGWEEPTNGISISLPSGDSLSAATPDDLAINGANAPKGNGPTTIETTGVTGGNGGRGSAAVTPPDSLGVNAPKGNGTPKGHGGGNGGKGGTRTPPSEGLSRGGRGSLKHRGDEKVGSDDEPIGLELSFSDCEPLPLPAPGHCGCVAYNAKRSKGAIWDRSNTDAPATAYWYGCWGAKLPGKPKPFYPQFRVNDLSRWPCNILSAKTP